MGMKNTDTNDSEGCCVMHKPRILVVGSANMDFVMRVDRLPLAGETVISSGTYEYIPGGKGANAAVAAARLGAEVLFCARLGNDLHGARLKEFYLSNGIASRFLTADKKRATGLAGILVEKDGTNRIVVYPGANEGITEDDLEDALLSYPDALFLQFEISDEIVRAAVHMAEKGNVPVFIDAGPARESYPLERLGKIEVFSPNETEAERYTGIAPTNANNALHACIRLRNRINAKYIVLKLGSRGAYVYDGVYSEIIPTYESDVVDTTAAGDAFSAAMTLEYLRSGDIVRAVKFANAVGTLTVMKPGASSSLPYAAEVDEFIKNRQIAL